MLLEPVKVKVDDSMHKLISIARVIVKDPQTLNVIPYDQNDLKAIDTAIKTAGLNLNPIVNEDLVKVPIPK